MPPSSNRHSEPKPSRCGDNSTAIARRQCTVQGAEGSHRLRRGVPRIRLINVTRARLARSGPAYTVVRRGNDSETLAPPPVDALNLKLPDYYINRELSQLAFNVRVLKQAMDPSVPLLERLKFLCISSTNLDEFFEIRVSGLKHRLAVNAAPAGPDNLKLGGRAARASPSRTRS